MRTGSANEKEREIRNRVNERELGLLWLLQTSWLSLITHAMLSGTKFIYISVRAYMPSITATPQVYARLYAVRLRASQRPERILPAQFCELQPAGS